MEVTQFTYFQQVGGFDCDPVSGELTYGLERLAMYVQGVDRVFDLNFNGKTGKDKVTYGDVFLQAEQEYSRYNFEHADTKKLLEHFRDAEAECKALLAKGEVGKRHLMVLPAYDQAIKASHIFNLLDARGVISVTERQGFILRVRELAARLLRGVAQDRSRRRPCLICGAPIMAELLLELFSEEIPARMQMRAAEDLARLLGDGLKGAGLSFDTVRSFATPRRLTVVVDGLPARSPDVSEEKKGPRVGAPDAAVQGLPQICRAQVAGAGRNPRRQEGRFLCGADRAARARNAGSRGRDRAGDRAQLPLAEIHALGKRTASLGASAAFHPLHLRRQGGAVRDRRHQRAARRRAAIASWRRSPSL